MNARSFLSPFFALLAISFTDAFAATTPEKLEGTTVVNAETAKKLIQSDKSIKIIDSRIKNEYAYEHLPGAQSIVYNEKSTKDVNFDAKLDSFDTSKLPADKGNGILIYCNGPECWKSYKASIAAVKAGYSKIFWFRTGIPDWKNKGYPTEK